MSNFSLLSLSLTHPLVHYASGHINCVAARLTGQLSAQSILTLKAVHIILCQKMHFESIKLYLKEKKKKQAGKHCCGDCGGNYSGLKMHIHDAVENN